MSAISETAEAEKKQTVTITVDGREIEAEPGELVIAAAERNGVYIPRFCYHPAHEFCRHVSHVPGERRWAARSVDAGFVHVERDRGNEGRHAKRRCKKGARWCARVSAHQSSARLSCLR